MKHVPILFFGVILFLSGACQKKVSDALATKAAPHDLFLIQRSYPDRDFDAQGWQKAMRRARQTEAVQERDNSCSGTLADWTLQGPANIAGRVNTLAVKPDQEQTLLAGFSGGGIFKTTDAGVNWRPVFDENPELSISDITFDPSNPNVVYAGTGDANMPAYVFNGEGIYKSINAGETWQYLGLQQAGIISKIIAHPTQPQVLYAATMGNPYVRTNERGIYKSTDGGQNWQNVLFISNQAGASDLEMDPSNPQVLYASFWDRIRNNSESVIFGDHARIYKTTDGGANWNMLSSGLPAGKMGRTALVISEQNPQKLYALYTDTLSTVGGIYVTTNSGNTWNPVSINGLGNAYANFGWYFGKILLHPDNDDELYLPAVQLWRKSAVSGSWVSVGAGHADVHDLIFTGTGRRYAGNDGGVYYQDPGNTAWTRCKNLPLTQFYRTNFNPHQPDTYFGGSQDNGTCKGNAQGINNWQNIFGGDGFRSAFHPEDAQIYWVETQNGAIHKTVDGGSNWEVGQTCLGTGDRCNWDTPYFLSRHNPDRLFAGTYRVHQNDFGSWSPASPDLTDGTIYGAAFHTVSCVEESPLIPEKLFAGTSDANVWRREPASAWTNISNGLPNRYVTSVQGSPTLPQRIFVTQSGFRDNEYIPHIHRSDNNGQTWIDITGDLPQMPVNNLFVRPGHADSMLFAATDAGVYFSRNAGVSWNRLGQNIPFIPVFDLEENPVRRQLIAATYARGLWTFPLDSVLIPGPGTEIDLAGNMGATGSISLSGAGQAINAEADGSFSFDAQPGCQDYTLTPYRNDNPVNGVTTFDLVLISKHILDLEPLDSPYKRIAADANRSGAITTFDIVQLRKLILGIDTAFIGNTSWRFVPENFIFPNPLDPFASVFPESLHVSAENTSLTDLDFVAIKTGDVNQTASPSLTNPAEQRSTPFPILLTDQSWEAGASVVVGWSADLQALTALQFSIRFDPKILSFEKIEPLMEGLTLTNFGTDKAGQGLISVSFETTGGWASTGTRTLFDLHFTARNSGTLAANIQMHDWPTPALAYRPDGAALRPVLLQKPEKNIAFAAPNPFGRSGCWLYYPEIKNSTLDLQIIDYQGKMIFQQSLQGSAPLFLDASIFPTPGTWFYRIRDRESGKKISAGKITYIY